MAALQPYPEYKDSGVPWLGEVPSHWEMRRGKALFRCIDIRSRTGEEELLTVSSDRGIVPRASAVVTMFKAESYVGYKLCWPGDLVINSLWAWGRGLGVSAHHGIVSSAYGVYRSRRPGEVLSAYVNELVRSKPFNWELQVRSKGIWISRLQLTDDAFLGAPFPIPPEPEQAAIVQFIQYVDRRIRRYIGAKQKLIKLLEEQKQAIIQHAVTRGLDPLVRFRPSGVDWVGDMPAHWQMWQLGFLARIGNGSTPSRSNSAYWSGGTYPWLNSSHVNQSSITAADQFVTEAALRECHLPIVSPDSVLIGITGQGKTRGKAAVLRFEATINQHVAFATPKLGVVGADYLRMALEGAYAQLRSISQDAGSTKGALTCEDLKHFRVPIPSLGEQQGILHAVSRELAATSTVIDQETRAIDFLREFRTRLIADIVTGKADVREAAARLPAEIADAETGDDAGAFDDAEAEMDADLDLETEEVGV